MSLTAPDLHLAFTSRTALHLGVERPKPLLPPGNLLLGIILALTGTALAAGAILVEYGMYGWGQLEACYASAPGLGLALILTLVLREHRFHAQALQLQQFICHEFEPALALAGVALRPSDCVTLLTKRGVLLNPAQNLYAATRIACLEDDEKQLIVVLSH